eukprot:CAMPEP_0179486560 /NCGR_PEP_ID=MMETSP0799-20121207/62815_1 /TAXON_ID=46947 /ORGANISM="Geminigera cryophila, Strain CCMP2564" /LENGTH=137 /DNA_ID=CAMNT_0021301343 /DNA_START=510 /DNA_END=920 /DNA_ORIENTATION=+
MRQLVAKESNATILAAQPATTATTATTATSTEREREEERKSQKEKEKKLEEVESFRAKAERKKKEEHHKWHTKHTGKIMNVVATRSKSSFYCFVQGPHCSTRGSYGGLYCSLADWTDELSTNCNVHPTEAKQTQDAL